MASAKSKKNLKEPRSEKIGELSGNRRVYAGIALLIAAIFFSVALAGYDAGQETFFNDPMHINSTDIPASNLCGKIGATFCSAMLSVFGVSTWLILVYVAYVGVLCFLKRPKLMRLAPLFSMLAAVVLLSVLAAFIQDYLNGIYSTEYFSSGWGGKIGTLLFLHAVHPAVDYFGSAIILPVLYAFAFIASFTESPLELVKETSRLAVKILVCIGKGILRVFKAFFSLFERKRKEEDEGIFQAPTKKPRSKKKVEFGLEEDNALLASPQKEDLEDTEEEELDDEDITLRIPEKEEVPPVRTAAIEEVLGAGAKIEKRPLAEVGENVASPLPSLKVSTLEEEKYTPPKQKIKKGNYKFPSVDLLNAPQKKEDAKAEDYESRMSQIIGTLDEFKIGVAPSEVFAGPVITRYEVKPNPGVRVGRIIAMEDDLAIGLKTAHVRVSTTSRGTVGIEVPNLVRQNVSMREIIESREWNESKASIPVVLGKDVTGKPVVLDLAKMPHALIAGSTGSGKSVCINVIVASLLYKCTPDDLRFVMVDPKVVELQVYNSLPHMLVPVVTDPKKVPTALNWLVKEMMKRYKIFEKVGVKNIIGFNAKILKDKEEQERAKELEAEQTPEERAMSMNAMENDLEGDGDEIEIPKKKMPYIVCIIDELADMMMVAGKEVEGAIARLTQLARAAGIHLLVATQRPSVDVVTGLIKANLPTRIGFRVASATDSRTILDSKGAETLIGWGDMLFIPPGSSDLIRAQGAFMSDGEIEKIVEAVAENGEPEFESAMQDELEAAGDGAFGIEGEWDDELTPQAFKVMKDAKRASVSFIQRKLRIGYNRAASIMDELEDKGFVGPDNGPSAPREILR